MMKFFLSLLFVDRVYQMLWVFKVKLYGQQFDDQLKRLTPVTERYLYYVFLTWLNWQVETVTSFNSFHNDNRFYSRWWIYCLIPLVDIICEHHLFQAFVGQIKQLVKQIITSGICLVLVNFFNFLLVHLNLTNTAAEATTVNGIETICDEERKKQKLTLPLIIKKKKRGLAASLLRKLQPWSSSGIGNTDGVDGRNNETNENNENDNSNGNDSNDDAVDKLPIPPITYSDLMLIWKQLETMTYSGMVSLLASAIFHDILFYYGPSALWQSIAAVTTFSSSPTTSAVRLTRHKRELRRAFAKKNYSFLLSASTVPKIISVYNDIEEGWLRGKFVQLFTMVRDWYLLVTAYTTLAEVIQWIILSIPRLTTFANLFTKIIFLLVTYFYEHQRHLSAATTNNWTGYTSYVIYIIVLCGLLEVGSILFSLFLLHPPHFLLRRICFNWKTIRREFPLNKWHLIKSICLAVAVYSCNTAIVTIFPANNTSIDIDVDIDVAGEMVKIAYAAIFYLLHCLIYQFYALGHFNRAVFTFLSILGFYSDWTEQTNIQSDLLTETQLVEHTLPSSPSSPMCGYESFSYVDYPPPSPSPSLSLSPIMAPTGLKIDTSDSSDIISPSHESTEKFSREVCYTDGTDLMKIKTVSDIEEQMSLLLSLNDD